MKGFYMVNRDFLRKLAMDATLTACDLRVIASVMALVKTPGDVVDVAINALVRFTGQSKRNVIRSRARLVERGYLVSEGSGSRNIGLYHLADFAEGVTPLSYDNPVTCDVPTGDGAVTPQVTPLSPVATIIHTNGNKDTTQNAAKKRSASTLHKLKVTRTATGFVLPEPLRLQWAKVYSELDIDRESAKAFIWCTTNPTRAPKKNYGRFLNSWFDRASGWKAEDRPKQEPDYEASAADVALWVEFEKQIAKEGRDNV